MPFATLFLTVVTCYPIELHRVYQVVHCDLWNVGPLLFNGR